MIKSPKSVEEHYAMIVKELLRNPEVSQITGKKGFGSSALWVRGKIFALLSSEGGVVFKLPRQRVDSLLVAGEGERFDPRHDGRAMKEWFVVKSSSKVNWLLLAKEAMEFVASKSQKIEGN